MTKRIFGHILGYPPGTAFENRKELHDSGVHRPPQAGISGSQFEGSDSIVVSGGYEDDADYGDRIIYTGFGGNDPKTGEQVADQDLINQNAALSVSCERGLPVRVVRGAKGDPKRSPPSGYRYDGLYRVALYWSEVGRSGFKIWRYELAKLPDQTKAPVTPYAKRSRAHGSSGPTPPTTRKSRRNSFICVICRQRRQVGEMSASRRGVCERCRDRPLR
jgi:putative restriction endonuclease